MSQFQGKAPRAFIRRSTFVAAFLFAATAAAPAQFAAQTFTVINGTAQTRTQEPVTFGFPVPKTPAVTSLTGFRIVNAAGQAVPAQFRALTRWGGDRDVATLPLRWVQASFKADAPANGASTYTVSWSSAGPAGTLSVVQTSSTVTVTTGTATSFVLSKTGFTLFNAATVNGTAILTGAGSLTMQAPGGASIPATSVTTVVEQSGSVSAVVRQNGSLGELRYTCRWTFFAGRSDVVVDFRLENPKCFGVAASNVPDGQVYFDRLFLNLPVGGTAPKVTSNVAQRTLTSGQTYEVRQLFNWTSDLSDVLAGFSFQEKVNGSNVHVGGRFPGAVDVSTSTVGVTVGVDRFWQSFPKSIKVEGGSVKVGLWPEYGSGPQFGGQYGTPTAPLPGVDAQSLNDYRFEGGRWKTHRMVFDFHASGARTAAQTASFAERVNAPVVGRADPVKVRQSMATGLLFVEDRDYWNFDSFKRYQRFVKIMGDDNEADSIATHGKVGLKKFLDSGCVNGGQQPYGWENYGDIPWADGYCDLHYDWPGSMLLGFLKTGHYGVYDRARDMAAFRRDYGQNHSTDAAEFWRGAQFYEKGWWHGNYSSGLNSHNWVLGLALNYVMFGDEASREAGLENIAYVKRDPPKTWSGMWGSRIPGWGIDNLVHAHNFFGDAAALTEAGLGVARFRDLEVASGMNGYHLNTGANPPSTDPWMDNIFFIAACRYVIASGDTQYHPFLQRMRTWLKTSCTVIPTTTSLASANLPYVWYMWSPGAPNTASSHLCWPMIDALSHSALLFNDAGDLAVASVLFESMTRYWQRPALSGPVNALNTATYSPITMRATGYPTSESKALGNVLLWGGSHLFVRAYFDGTL